MQRKVIRGKDTRTLITGKLLNKPKYLFLGEAYGEREAQFNKPFVGRAGELLTSAMLECGIHRSDEDHVRIINVFMFRPKDNNVLQMFATAKENVPICDDLEPYRGSYYLKREYLLHLVRMRARITAFNPDVIIVLGATALWALTGYSMISNARGNVLRYTNEFGDRIPIVAAYHPAYILRDISKRPELIKDFRIAKAIAKKRTEHVSKNRTPPTEYT